MSTARTAIVLAVTLCAAAGTSSPALADPNPHVAEAREAIDNLDYERARVALGRASRTGDNEPAQLAEIFLWSGVVAGAFGEEQNAFDFFVQALTIDGDAKLPRGLAPKITKPFDQAREFVDEHGGLEIACEPGRRPGTAVLTTRNDPAGLVFGAHAEVDRAGETERVAIEGSDRFVLRDLTSRAPVVLYAVDRFGNRVSRSCRTRPRKPAASSSSDARPEPTRSRASDPDAQLGAELDVGGDRGPFATDARDDVDRPLLQRWYLWGGTSLALAATGAYFGAAALSDQAELDRRIADSASYDFAETQAIEDRGRQRGVVAGVTLGAAAVTAGVALYMALRDDDPDDERAAAMVAPIPGGASVGVAWSF